MSAEVAPIVYVLRGGAIIRTLGGEITLTHSEPCPWSVQLDNSDGLYNPSSSVAAVRDSESVYHTIVVSEPDLSDSWTSPDLLVEDYDYDTDTVQISGRCRLAQLDRDDQVIEVGDGLATAEGMTVAALLTLIASHCGLTVVGAPTRVVPQYHLTGNPLQMFRDLLEPTHGFRMATGGQIQCFSLTTRPLAGSLKDDEDLEILRFRRSTELRNRVTIERIVEKPGPVVLFHESRSGGDTLGNNGPFQFSEPSRRWWIANARAARGEIQYLTPWDESGNPMDGPVGRSWSRPILATHEITFVYAIGTEASAWGPWTPNWELEIHGYPLDMDPPSEEGYSVTVSAGAGDRPATEPFTAVSINTEADATAAANALLDQYLREGQILNMATRLRPAKIWPAGQEVDVEDHQSGIGVNAVLESTSVTWGESDTGTINYETTFKELT